MPALHFAECNPSHLKGKRLWRSWQTSLCCAPARKGGQDALQTASPNSLRNSSSNFLFLFLLKNFLGLELMMHQHSLSE